MENFREWLEKSYKKMGAEPYDGEVKMSRYRAFEDILEKFDELEKLAIKPITPKFNIGDMVFFTESKSKAKIVQVIVDRILPSGVCISYRLEGFGGISSESSLRLAPRNKHVFSLQKWVERGVKEGNTTRVINYLDSMKQVDGKTEEEIRKMGYAVPCSNLFVEVDECN